MENDLGLVLRTSGSGGLGVVFVFEWCFVGKSTKVGMVAEWSLNAATFWKRGRLFRWWCNGTHGRFHTRKVFLILVMSAIIPAKGMERPPFG